MKANSISYPGLTPLIEHPELEYDFVSIFEEFKWSQLAFKTIYYSFLKLQSEGFIKLTLEENEHRLFFNIISFKTSKITVKPISDDREVGFIDDLLSRALLAIVIFKTKANEEKADLKAITRSLIDRYLVKHEEYNRPEKKFLVRNFEKYESYAWFKITTSKQLKGIYNTYKVEINSDLRTELTEELKIFKSHIQSLNGTVFHNKLKQIISNYFHFKRPSSTN